MNKNESKYFHTAELMDKAFLELLDKKDFAYITVKEICAKAGVNRSTFYLHYESIADLLAESTQYIFSQFRSYMNPDSDGIVAEIRECPIEELYLITPEYLFPYLSYLKEHKKLFKTMLENSAVLELKDAYTRMFRHVFTPILERFQVPEEERRYMIMFYIHGIMAITTEWLEEDCRDSIEYVMEVIQHCTARHYRSKEEKSENRK